MRNRVNRMRGRVLGPLGVLVLLLVIVVATRGGGTDQGAPPLTLDFTSGTSVPLVTTTTTPATTTPTRPPTAALPTFDVRGWSSLSANDLEPRIGFAALMAGDRAVVWGGVGTTGFGERSDGASYLAGRWTPMAESPIVANANPVAVWTGRELFFSSGAAAAWNPATDTWRSLAYPPTGSSEFGHPLTGV